MADEKVDIKLKVEVIDRELKGLIAKVKALEAMERRLASGRSMQRYSNNSSRSLTDMARKMTRSFDFVDSAIKATGKLLSGFLKVALKGVIIEMGLLSIALVGVHALFASGRFLIKAYHGVMKLIAGGAAVAGAAIAAVSAAIREQQAAMFAYRGKGAPQFGSAMNQTRMAMRNLQTDASLASLGVETLNKAFGVMSKTMNVNQINASGRAIKALMDFGSAGQDPAQSIESVAEVIAALSNQEKSVNDVIAAAKKLGPEMQKALKDAKVKTKKDFEELLFSGKLAEMGGVAGQFDAVNNTLINVLKSYFTQVRGAFADFGDQFIEPLKVGFQQMFWAIQDGLVRMGAVIGQTIGFDGLINGTVRMVEKVTDFTVNMMRKYLPSVNGMFERLGELWNSFTRGWNIFFDKLRPLEKGANSLYAALRPIWESIKDGAQNLFLFKDLLTGNAEVAVEFGERIAGFIDSISELFMNLKKIFFEIAPFINDVLSGLNSILKIISKLLTSGVGKGFSSALAPLLAFSVFGRAMGGTRGLLTQATPGLRNSFLQKQAGAMSTASMTVNAAQVTIAGGLPFGPGRAPGVPAGVAPSPMAPPPSTGGGGGSATLASGGSAAHGMGIKAFGEELKGSAKTVRDVHGLRDVSKDARKASEARFKEGDTLRSGGPYRPPIAYMGSQDPTLGLAGHMKMGALTTMSPGVRRQRIFGAGSPSGMLAKGGLAATKVGFGIRGALAGIKNYAYAGGYNPEKGEFAQLYDIPVLGDDGRPTGEMLPGLKTKLQATYDEDPRRQMGKFGKASAYLAHRRRMMRMNRTETKLGRMNQRFAGSAGGRLGTSMGLSLASQYAPEEMRGAMALGGMAAQFDPRLGLAVAGVGGALSAKSSGMGALAGAAGGAQIGMIFGPMGAAVGAGIGALAGAISGHIRGANAKLDEAKNAAVAGLQRYYNEIIKAGSFSLSENAERVKAGKRVGGRGVFQGFAEQMKTGKAGAFEFVRSEFGKGKPGQYFDTQDSDVFYSQMVQAMYDQQGTGLLKDVSVTKKELDAALKNEDTAAEFIEARTGFATRNRIKGSFDENLTQSDIIKNMASESRGATQSHLEYNKALDAVGAQTNMRIAELGKISGKSGAELEVLAQELGVNLYDPTIKFTDLIAKLGLTMLRTSAQINDAMTDIVMAGANAFRKRREQREAQAAADASTEKLRAQLDSGLTGDARQEAIDEYGENIFAQNLALAGGDPVAAYFLTQGQFGAGENAGVFAEGEALAGYGKELSGQFAQPLATMRTDTNKLMAEQVQGLLGTGGQFGDLSQIESQVAKLSDAQLKALFEYSQKGGNFAKIEGDKEAIASVLKTLNLEGVKFDKMSDETDKVANAYADGSKDFKDGVDQFKAATEKIFANYSQRPEWFSKEAFEALFGDTSTPRGDTTSSRLSQTMARHAAFDGMLTGNRTVTSSYRTMGLGSINSDHVMGRAYDLTGQNLGQYAKLVHDNGGFAEFHGTLANRHLHVVPGIGDTAMPAVPMQVMNQPASGKGGGNTYNIEINGTNQSPEQIANMVVAKIDQRERSMSERS